MTCVNQHTILASWVDTIINAAELEWPDLAHVCERGKIGVPTKAQSGCRLPHHIMRSVWDEACRYTGDPAFPLLAARNLRPNRIHTLGYYLLAAESLDDICNAFQRHFHVISTAAALKITVNGNQYRITSVSEPAVNNEGFEMFMAFLTELIALQGTEDVNPLKVTLRRHISSGAAREQYTDFFHAPVEFGAQENCVVFPRQAMFEPLKTANPEIRKYCERQLAIYLNQFGSGEFKTLVRSKILELLPNGSVTEADVARGLSLSRSSLVRRLRQEGTSYRKLFNQTQLDLALQYLKDPHLPIGEISIRLGFQDVSSFSRSFRREVGMAPREWRQRHLNS